MIQLGDLAQDKITGFKGIVTGIASYLTGCDQLCLQPKTKDGESGTYPEAKWFDEGRLIKISEEFAKSHVAATKNGSDYTAPIK